VNDLWQVGHHGIQDPVTVRTENQSGNSLEGIDGLVDARGASAIPVIGDNLIYPDEQGNCE